MSTSSGGATAPAAANTSSSTSTTSSTPMATAPSTINGTSAASTTTAPIPSAGPASKPGPGEPWWNRETRRVSDPSRAQQLWDAIVAVRAQKQIPAIVRMSRYMNRFYQVNKEQTQRLLDTAVEDNLIKLERKVGTKGNKSGVEEKAYRLPTSDMLPRERHDWYCFHCHSGGEVLLCEGCHRVYHESCLKAETAACAQLKEARSSSQDDQDQEHDQDQEDEDERDRSEWFCLYCKASQNATAEGGNKKARKDLNHLLRILCNKLRNRLPERILHREAPQPVQKAVNDPTSGIGGAKPEEEDADASGVGEDGTPGKVKNGDKEDAWRASFLLKSLVSFFDKI